MTSPVEESSTDTSKSLSFSGKPPSRFLLALPAALFVVGCGVMAFEMIMNTARGVGIMTLTMHLVAGGVLMVILGIPFAYQMHTTGNDKGLALGISLWVLVGLFNLGTLMSYWPLRLAIAANKAKLVGIHRSLGPDEARSMVGGGGVVPV